MSLKGILKGQKGFIQKLLEPYGIDIQGIKTNTIDDDGSSYTFIWDSLYKEEIVDGKWVDTRSFPQQTRYKHVEEILQKHFLEADVQVESPTARFVRTGKGARWRSVAEIYFYTKDE